MRETSTKMMALVPSYPENRAARSENSACSGSITLPCPYNRKIFGGSLEGAEHQNDSPVFF